MSSTVELTLQGTTITLEVYFGAAGPAGPGLPAGGVEFDLIEKASGVDHAMRFTKSPKVSSLILNPALPVAGALAQGQLTWDTFHLTAKMKVGSDGAEGAILHDGFIGPVKNTGIAAVTKGMPLCFAGAVAGTNQLEAVPMVADGSVAGRYLLGLAAEDFAAGAAGLGKTVGLIKDLDTTGAAVTETWVSGDILYVHPTVAGALTKVRPAAPDLVLPLAVVLQVHATTGSLYVRVSIKDDFHFGAFYSTQVQNLVAINTPKAVEFNATQLNYAVRIGAVASQIVFDEAGVFNLSFSLQADKAGGGTSYLYYWGRKNGVDVPNTATRIAVLGNNAPVAVLGNFYASMLAGDYYEIMWASDDIGVHLDYDAALAWMPAIPSALLTVSQVTQ